MKIKEGEWTYIRRKFTMSTKHPKRRGGSIWTDDDGVWVLIGNCKHKWLKKELKVKWCKGEIVCEKCGKFLKFYGIKKEEQTKITSKRNKK